jgi:hypothetical protein
MFIHTKNLLRYMQHYLLMQPNTMRARGWSAGLKQNAKLFASAVQVCNHSQLGMSRIHA